jgi:hypothetical protein
MVPSINARFATGERLRFHTADLNLSSVSYTTFIVFHFIIILNCLQASPKSHYINIFSQLYYIVKKGLAKSQIVCVNESEDSIVPGQSSQPSGLKHSWLMGKFAHYGEKVW